MQLNELKTITHIQDELKHQGSHENLGWLTRGCSFQPKNVLGHVADSFNALLVHLVCF